MDFRAYTTEDYHEVSQALNDAEQIHARIKDAIIDDLIAGIYMGERKMDEYLEAERDSA